MVVELSEPVGDVFTTLGLEAETTEVAVSVVQCTVVGAMVDVGE